MTVQLPPGFERVRDVGAQGGQGISFIAREIETGRQVFVKALRHGNLMRARKRFRREVAAYETIIDAGLPALVYENSSEWKNPTVPLLMILDVVDGCDLREKVSQDGHTSLSDAASCVIAVGNILDKCHAVGVIHRDIKPANVMLRNRDLADPVLIDFGLSFNQEELPDITRIEEIGNRFFRLPEHAAGGNSRSHVSDVTQLAGLLLYCLTAREPRVLLDEFGRPPHQREPTREQLAAVATGRTHLRLSALFDRAFNARIDGRFQDVATFIQAVDDALEEDADMDHDEIEMKFQGFTSSGRHLEASDLESGLQLFPAKVHEVVGRLASASRLLADQTAQMVRADVETPFAETQMRMFTNAISGTVPVRVTYRFEMRGGEIVFRVGDEDLWRGNSVDDPELAATIERVAKQAFVQTLPG